MGERRQPNVDGIAATLAVPSPVIGTDETVASIDLSGTAATLAAGSGTAPAGAASDFAIGSKLGRYEIRGVLGRGGMGVVYSAFDPDLDRNVAIKLLHPALAAEGDAATARLVREGRAIAKLAHPNVVAVFDVGTHMGAVFIAMELVDGRSLDTWITAEPHPWREVVRVFLQAGDGLLAAHAAGLIHRDFKPANVLLGTDGRARVTDFGVARIDGAPRTPSHPRLGAAQDLQLTRPGAMIGTPAYMSPEQLDGDEVDARADQFAFAVALYEALYQERPFEGSTLTELYDNVTREQVRAAPPASRVPVWLRAILLRGMRAARDARYPTLTALLDELRSTPAMRQRRVIVGVGAIALCGVAAGVMLIGRAAHVPAVDCERQADDRLAEWRAARSKLPVSDVLAPLDRHVDGWRATAIQLCRKPNPDSVLRGLEQSCLTSYIDMYDTLGVQLRAPSAGMLEMIGHHLTRSETPTRCPDHPRKSYPTPLPTDDIKRQQALVAREKYLRSATHGPELSLDAANTLAREAVALAEQSGDAVSAANAWSVLGGGLLDVNDTDAAAAAFRKSLTFAEQGGATGILAFSHTLLANVLCNSQGHAEDCDAEIERASSYFVAHPEEGSLQFELTHAGYLAARLQPERGVASLRAWLVSHPDDVRDPYMGDQLARVEILDGKPRAAQQAIGATLANARKTGVATLIGELLGARCGYQVELGDIAGARASLAELVQTEARDASMRGPRLECEAALAVAMGELPRALILSHELAKLREEPNDTEIGILLAQGHAAAARELKGSPLKATAVLDWTVVYDRMAQFDFALATNDLTTARALVNESVAMFAKLPSSSYSWYDLLSRQSELELAAGDVGAAVGALDRARKLIASRGDDASLVSKLLLETLTAEACLRTGRELCGDPLRVALTALTSGGTASLETHVAAMLAAETAATPDTPAMCREWKWLAPYRAAPPMMAVDAHRIAKRCH
ncbi:hypothetical protein BH11MYX2_BH11MYX2_23290 [soil metagenome]